MAKTLISCVADVNARDEEGNTPLHLAVQAGHTQMVSTLLHQARVDVNAVEISGANAVHLAAETGNDKLLTLLLVLAPHLARRRDSMGQTPLHRACVEGRASTASVLLTFYPIQMYARDVTGWTPLHVAIFCDHEDVARLLLARDPLLAASTNEATTVLQLAQTSHARGKLSADFVGLVASLSPAPPRPSPSRRGKLPSRNNCLWRKPSVGQLIGQWCGNSRHRIDFMLACLAIMSSLPTRSQLSVFAFLDIDLSTRQPVRYQPRDTLLFADDDEKYM